MILSELNVVSNFWCFILNISEKREETGSVTYMFVPSFFIWAVWLAITCLYMLSGRGTMLLFSPVALHFASCVTSVARSVWCGIGTDGCHPVGSMNVDCIAFVQLKLRNRAYPLLLVHVSSAVHVFCDVHSIYLRERESSSRLFSSHRICLRQRFLDVLEADFAL
jgi:hypothetical protein